MSIKVSVVEFACVDVDVVATEQISLYLSGGTHKGSIVYS